MRKHVPARPIESLEPRLLLNANPLLDAGPGDPSALLAAHGFVGSASFVSDYRLTILAFAKDDVANTFKKATDLPLDATGSASMDATIDYAQDIDLFRIVATKTGTLTAEMAAGSSSSWLDPILGIYAADHSLLVRDDAAVTAPGSQISLPVVAGQTYFIGAAALGNTRGAYELTITTVESAPALPSIHVEDVSIAEGDAGTKQAVFTVTLSRPGDQAVTVSFATQNQEAVAGSDYTAKSGTLSFEPGETAKTISVTIRGDSRVEADETFLVNLSGVSGATITDAQAVGTITNDDATALSISDVTIAEGDSGTTLATFTVTLSNPSDPAVSVTYATADGTATAGSDYVATSGVLSFSPTETSKTVRVTVNGDTLAEANETFSVVLSGATGATIADASGTGTILDDDQPTISVADVSVIEGNSGTKLATFTISLSQPSASTVTVAYATADGSAAAGSDYTAASGTVSFAPGEISKTISVTVHGDTTVEPDETFTLDLSTPTNATIANGRGVGTILNDDVPALRIADALVLEGHSGTGVLSFTLTLSQASYQTVTVSYVTADGTATAGSDYTAASGTVSFLAGETAKTISVVVSGDTRVEPDETLTVNLSGATGATIADAQAAGTIRNDDAATLSISDVTVIEGNSGTKTATFTVTLSNASDQTVAVNYATANGTATAGSDYVAKSGMVTFAPGETSKPITVTVNGDTDTEPDETFLVVLSGPTHATIADASGTGTITNDDQPALAVADATVTEGNSGTKTLTFAVTLSQVSGQTVTVSYATADGTAAAGSDYVATSGTLSFAPGETSKTVSVTINGDTAVEPDEAFTLTLSGAAHAMIADAQATGTIVNDDVPTLAIGDASLVEGNSGTGVMTFTVTLSQASYQAVTVGYATANGSAVAGSDYVATSGTLSFSSGQTSRTISVTIVGDSSVEGDETFLVNLSGPDNATIADGQATGTIQNDDTDPDPDPVPDIVPGVTVAGYVVDGPGGLQFLVLGTDGNDSIVLSQTAQSITMVVSGSSQVFAGAFSSVMLYGFAGDDTLRTANTVTAGASLYGGDGNDSLFAAGPGGDQLFGGAGDDLLVSVGGGADTLRGEAGLDSFWVDSADSVADASSTENAATAVHQINAFYQPYSSDPGSASYVPLEIAGQNFQDPSAGYAYRSFADRALFVDGPEYNDIRQGNLGDCYFLAALSSLADAEPQTILQAIAPMGDGTYVVRYYRSGVANYLRIDADLPASGSNPGYAKLSPDGELWVPLMEKAYAHFRRGENTYSSLSGGLMSEVNTAVVNKSSTSKGSTATDLFDFIRNGLESGQALTAASTSSASSPIAASHGYAIMSTRTSDSQQYITVYNPWGYDGYTWDSNSSDGLIELTLAQFQARFTRAYACDA